FEEQVVRTVEQCDKILLSLRAVYQKSPEQFDIESARSYIGGPISQISTIGPDGFLEKGIVKPPSGARIDLSDREHFRVHLNTDKDDLFISKPVIGKVTGRLSIRLSRRLSNAD